MRTIAVIFGGKSAEHDVSIITAHIPIIDTLLSTGEYDVWPVYISKEGKWYSDKRMNDLRFFKEPDWESQVAKWKPLELLFEDGLQLCWPRMFGKCVKIDVVFPSMHGTFGEDGSLMGVLRMADVPFVGCDIFASAVAMDKVLTKQVVAAEGMAVVPYVWFTRPQWQKDAETYRHAIRKLKFPLFVKPVHLGSSIGITKAKNDAELENAIEVALHYDHKVLVEEGVEPLLEVTLPIMGNDEVRTAECERPLNKTEMFDFNDKYLSGGKQSGVNSAYSEIPAQIGEELTKKIKELGEKVYRTLGCSGIARVDFLVNDKTKHIYVNEVNTLPGSLYHHNWKKAGVSNRDLVLGLIQLGEERYASQKGTQFDFSSDILKKVGGPKIQN
ncbi:MAG TPA: D-alanine--D-alanine ligase family protein [Candidatus Paceibacterota bacterium]|nr:D-alanine--D-alanine ligase family protein [Candidatus Paceibacterota bacterium]